MHQATGPPGVEGGMRGLAGRGFGVVAGVVAGLVVLVLAGRLAAPPAGTPNSVPSVTHTGTIRYIDPPPGTPPEPPSVWSTMPAAPSGRPSRFTAGRVRLTLPPGWHGRVASDGRVLTVQAANFPLPARGIGEDPDLAMTPAQVLLTLSDGVGPAATSISISPTIGEKDFLHDGRVPVGRALARTAVRRHGMVLYIDALFGSRLPPPSLVQQANKVLTSLRLTVA
jgi:hypothetical protein